MRTYMRIAFADVFRQHGKTEIRYWMKDRWGGETEVFPEDLEFEQDPEWVPILWVEVRNGEWWMSKVDGSYWQLHRYLLRHALDVRVLAGMDEVGLHPKEGEEVRVNVDIRLEGRGLVGHWGDCKLANEDE